MKRLWLILANTFFRIGFFGEDTGDWCFDRHAWYALRDERRAKRREVIE